MEFSDESKKDNGTLDKILWEFSHDKERRIIQCGSSGSLAVLVLRKKKTIEDSYTQRRFREVIDQNSLLFFDGVESNYYLLRLEDTPPGDYVSIQNKFGIGYLFYGSSVFWNIEFRSYIKCNLDEEFDDLSELSIISYNEISMFFNHDFLFFLDYPHKQVPELVKRFSAGKYNPKYKTIENAEFAAIDSLVAHNYELKEIWNIYVEYNMPGLGRRIQYDPYLTYSLLEDMYYQALNYLDNHESENSAIAKRYMCWAIQSSWKGRDGACTKAVYIAHLLIAYRANKIEYSASARELAEIAGVSISTAHRATQRLISEGYIGFCGESVNYHSAIYQLLHIETNINVLNIFNIDVCSITLGHDAFRRRGLGKGGWEVWILLQTQQLTISEISKITGRDPSTIHRILTKLKSITDPETGSRFTLVSAPEGYGGYWEGIEINDEWEFEKELDKVAVILGTAGLGYKQKIRHEKDRADYRSFGRND